MCGKSLATQEVNRMLDKIRVGITKAYQEICDKDNYVTAEKVRNAFLGMGQNHKTLLAVFRQHNEDYAKQVGKMKSIRSYWKYCTVYNHLEKFIKSCYKMSDIALKELIPAFITDFELFLRIEKNHCTNTIWSYMMPLKRMVYMSIKPPESKNSSVKPFKNVGYETGYNNNHRERSLRHWAVYMDERSGDSRTVQCNGGIGKQRHTEHSEK